MSRESYSAFKVGVFVLVAICALTFFALYVSDLPVLQKGKAIHATFHFTNGLKRAAPVRLAGMDVGLVKDMKVVTEKTDTFLMKVVVELWLRDNVAIPVDSQFTINQLGFFGEKYVEVTPGKSLEFLKPGSTVTGVDPVAIEKVSERVNILAMKIEKTVDEINNGILTEENQLALAQTLDGVRFIVNNVREGKGTVGKFLMDDAVYVNLEELSFDLKQNPWKLLYRPRTKDK